MMISLVDIIFILIILYFAISSAQNGLIKEVFGKLAVIFGVLAGVYFCGILTPYLARIVNFPVLDTILAFMLIFTAVFLFIKIVQIILSGLFKCEVLKSLDKALGFFLGVIEGTLIVSAVLILIVAQPWFNSSKLIENCAVWKFLEPILSPSVAFVSSKLV